MATIAAVLTRPLETTASSGKSHVLRCIIEALQTQHQVSTISLTEAQRPAGGTAITCSFAGTSAAAAGGALRGRSLNSSIYDGRRIVSQIEGALTASGEPDLVLIDGVRLWRPVQTVLSSTPSVAYLDDLLSRRYRSWADTYSGSQFELGALPLGLAEPLRRVAGRAVFPFLRLEANRLEREERMIAESADRTVLISPEEARLLTDATGRRVAWATPPPADLPGRWDPDASFTFDAVFVGSSSYLPNRHAIEVLEHRIVPGLRRTLGRKPVIGLVGESMSRRYRAELEPLGFVHDLDKVFARSRCLIAYGLLPGGIKTKVLHAMAYGLPVVASTGAFEGIDEGRRTVGVLADSDLECCLAIARIGADRGLAKVVSATGRRLVSERFTPERFVESWLRVVDDAIGEGVS